MTPYEEEKTARQGTTKRLFTGDMWRTPMDILELIFETLGDVDHDPCANEDPEYQFAHHNWTFPEHDGSKNKWLGSRLFANVPFSKTGAWVKKQSEELDVNSILLVPPSVGSCYWHECVWNHEHVDGATRLCFYKGRIDFLAPQGMKKISPGAWEYDASAPWVPYKINRYDTAFILRGAEYEDPFCRVFERVGRMVVP